MRMRLKDPCCWPGARSGNCCRRPVAFFEWFRPFGPSVLAEFAEEWFEVGRSTFAMDAMLVACPVRPARAVRIPAVVHKDGTARLQLVHRAGNPRSTTVSR